MSGLQGFPSIASVENPWNGKLHEKPSPTSSSNVSKKRKANVENASRMPNLSAGHDDGDSSGLEQSLDDEFGIPSVKTPGARRTQAEYRSLGSDPHPQRLGRTRNPV